MQCMNAPDAAGGSPTAPLAARSVGRVVGHKANAYSYGIDFGWKTVSARAARAMGARFAASYLSTDASKNWSTALINSYHAAGLATVCVWETTARRALAGYAAGQADASSAFSQERALGVPTWKPIYFAVDFNETAAQSSAVASYFRGVDAVLGVGRVGGYGTYWTVDRLFNAGLVHFGWQTSAWSGGRWDPRAQLQQYAYRDAFDWDRAVSPTYGGTY